MATCVFPTPPNPCRAGQHHYHDVAGRGATGSEVLVPPGDFSPDLRQAAGTTVTFAEEATTDSRVLFRLEQSRSPAGTDQPREGCLRRLA
jgi:hypothetical protein